MLLLFIHGLSLLQMCVWGIVCGVALLLFLVKEIAECFCLKCDVAVCTIRGLVWCL